MLLFVFDAMLDRLPQWPKPKWLAYDEAVQSQCKDQRMALGLLKQLFELIDDHVSKLATRVITVCQCAGIIQFHRIGNRQELSRACLHPYGLVVEWPIQ